MLFFGFEEGGYGQGEQTALCGVKFLEGAPWFLRGSQQILRDIYKNKREI